MTARTTVGSSSLISAHRGARIAISDRGWGLVLLGGLLGFGALMATGRLIGVERGAGCRSWRLSPLLLAGSQLPARNGRPSSAVRDDRLMVRLSCQARPWSPGAFLVLVASHRAD